MQNSAKINSNSHALLLVDGIQEGPGGSGAVPGNSQLGIAGITNSPDGGYGGPGGLVFHQAWAEDDPRGLVLHQGGVGLVLHQGGVGEVLEAWYDTRAVQVWSWRPGMTPGRRRGGPRGLVLHQGGWDRCGPRGDDWLDPNGC